MNPTLSMTIVSALDDQLCELFEFTQNKTINLLLYFYESLGFGSLSKLFMWSVGSTTYLNGYGFVTV